ncbi:MAG: hypothetical protein B6D58_09830 [candidate division Zixibacteria bacterium 4484_95]|nr:MAG: hypothetical protein B6D58_09830 [candidate division Zixibacteria bacterium 4484_95]RKX17292.1 MAG: hypothetical protein DRP26_07235 [candidate division Zixibacteria bacterium]
MLNDDSITNKSVKHIINEVNLILSEKRTALSVLRTGIAIIMFPLSVLTVLVATSRFFDIKDALIFAIPLGFLCLVFFIYGVLLVIRSSISIRKYDELAKKLLKQSNYLSQLLDLE